jgi:hypothetical protein
MWYTSIYCTVGKTLLCEETICKKYCDISYVYNKYIKTFSQLNKSFHFAIIVLGAVSVDIVGVLSSLQLWQYCPRGGIGGYCGSATLPITLAVLSQGRYRWILWGATLPIAVAVLYQRRYRCILWWRNAPYSCGSTVPGAV